MDTKSIIDAMKEVKSYQKPAARPNEIHPGLGSFVSVYDELDKLDKNTFDTAIVTKGN